MEEHHPIFSRETKRKEGRRFPNPLIKKRFESETSESDIIKPAITKQVGLKEPSYKTRIISSLAAILGFILILLAGHTYCLLLVLAINIMIFKEIITLKQNSQRESKLPYSSLINWYFFGVTELVATYFFLSHRVIMSSTLNNIMKYKFLIIFGTFVFGIVLFVVTLRKGQYRYQFTMFAWTLVTCVLVVAQSTTAILNIYEGIIWFFLPTALIIINGFTVNLFGVLIGRTPLIKLAPTKTIEGFLGGLPSTIVSAFIVFLIQLTNVISRFEYFLCPQESISFTPFLWHSCNTSDLLSKNPLNICGLTLYLTNLELHSMVLALFVGLIAPFGGFFASGVKRAFKIKDFGDSILGHGSLTNVMECQILMGMFTSVWIHTMVSKSDTNIQSILNQISNLSYSDQLKLFQGVKDLIFYK